MQISLAAARAPGRLTRLVMALLAGSAMALGQAPVSWPVMLFLALPLLLWLLDKSRDPRGAFGVGWLAGVGFFAAALFWIVEPFLVDPERYGWMAPFALVFLSGGLALFWGLAFALARALWPRRGRGYGARIIILAALWTLMEYARSNLFTGFPWALQAYAWSETPVMQGVALVGPHGLGMLTLVAALLPGVNPLRGGVAALAVVAAGWGYGALRMAEPVATRAEPVVVRLVQPNAAQDLKWLPDMQQTFYDRHLAETRTPADPSPDVTVWSETAVPFVLGYADALQAESAAAVGPQGRLILGIRRLEVTPEGERWYNSLAALRPDGQPAAVYDKHHLAPFGEYLPFASLIARLGVPALEPLTQAGFSRGPGPRLMSVPGLPPFLPLICYEAIFPNEMRAPEGRPEWILQVTNDAWFGTLSGPYQHLAQARSRAIEQGLPLARAANTGISAMIDGRGRILASLPLGVAGHLDAPLPPPLAMPLYARTGDWPALLLILVSLGLTVAINSRGILGNRGR